MNLETKDRLLGMFLAIMDGRDPLLHVTQLDGHQCLECHEVIAECDALLKAQWRLSGAPGWDEQPEQQAEVA